MNQNNGLNWSLKLDYGNLDKGATEASNAFKKISQESDLSARSLSATDKQLKQTGDVAKKASSKIKRAFIGLTSLIGITTIFATISGSMDGAISRLDTINNYTNVMANLDIGAKDANTSIRMLNKGLMGIPTSLDDAVLAVQRFTAVNNDVVASTNMFLAFNNAVLAGGAGADLQASALEQMSQAYAKGKPDMMEWRSLMQAMPAQLNQVAKAMNFVSADELGESLRNGKTTMNDFMATIVRLDKEGVGNFLSFSDQAKNATGGVGTAIRNMRTAITRGITDVMNAIGQANIASFFHGITRAINTATAYAVAFVNVMKAIFGTISSLFGRSKNAVSSTGKEISKTSSGVSSMNTNLGKSSDALNQVGSSAKKTAKEVQKLTQLGIDELNIISPPESSDSGGSGAGGDTSSAVGALGGLGDMSIAPDIDMSGLSKAEELTQKFLGTWETLKNKIIENKVPILVALTAIGAGIATAFVLPKMAGFATLVSNFGVLKAIGATLANVFSPFITSLSAVSVSAVAVIAVVMAVVGAITQLWLTNEDFRNNVIKAWNGIKDTFKQIWDTTLKPIIDSLTTAIVNVWNEGVKPLWDGWVDFVDSIVTVMTELWNEVLKPYVDWFIQTFGPKIANTFDQVSKVVSFVMSAIGIVIGGAFRTIGIYVEGLVDVFIGIIKFLKGVFTSDWKLAWEGVKGIFSGIVNTFSGIFKSVWDTILKLFSAGGKIFLGIKDGIVGVFKAVVNGLIGGINKVVAIPFNGINNMLNSIRNVGVLGIKPFSGLWKQNPVPVPQIPKFADGNIAYGPVFAQFGEYEGVSRDPEVTTPLSKLKDMLPSGDNRATVEELKENNRLLRELLEKDTVVTMSAKKVGEITDKKKAQIARQKGQALVT